MLDAIVLTLMLVIVLCVFVQKTEARMMIAATFAFITLAHDLYFHYISDNIDAYYLSAGIVSLVVIFIISAMKESPRLARDIQDISLISIMFNGLGWLLYKEGMQPDGYMAIFALLYGWAIITLIKGEPKDDRDFEIDTRLFPFHRNVYKRDLLHTGKQEEK